MPGAEWRSLRRVAIPAPSGEPCVEWRTLRQVAASGWFDAETFLDDAARQGGESAQVGQGEADAHLR
ncbi:hypothetical protein BH18CHL1_BH18CHL1_08350 [soil metagenome]